MTDQPLAEIRDYNSLHQALRIRAAQLEISRLDLDRLAYLTPGHASKLLSPRPTKWLGNQTLNFVLPALGVKLILVEDPEALARIRATTRRRNSKLDPTKRNAAVSFSLSNRFFRRIGRKGGENSRKYMMPERATEIAARPE
jgi:hypothetical protein